MINTQETLRVRITLTEEMLGMSSATPFFERTHIEEALKMNDVDDADEKADEEKVALEDGDDVEDNDVAKQLTVFPRDNESGDPILWDYQLKGWLKDAWSMLRKIPKSECSKVKSYKKNIDGLLFPMPRKIIIHIPEGSEITYVERPLRANTPQGERIALAVSEAVPAGSWIEFSIVSFDKGMIPGIIECLDYGVYRGLGQWRNSGKGRFEYEIIG